MLCGVVRMFVTVVKPLQPEKALLPIVVTELPIITQAKMVQ
jgi:hypothetical protein